MFLPSKQEMMILIEPFFAQYNVNEDVAGTDDEDELEKGCEYKV